MSYSTVLHFLLAYELCEREEGIRCTLQHNGQVWDSRDDAFYVIANGDYIKLQVVGRDGMGWVDLQSSLRHVEVNLQRRSIYGAALSSTGGLSVSDFDEDPQSPIEPDGEPDVCSMMQIASRFPQAKVLSSEKTDMHLRAFTAGSGETPVSWTHVTDRWCSPQGSPSDPARASDATNLHGWQYSTQDGPAPRKFQISLAAHVEPESCAQQTRNFDLPLKIADIAGFLTAWTNAPLATVRDLPSTVELHESTKTTLNGQSKEAGATVLHIFTDGSAADGIMAWSFVVVATNSENYRSATACTCCGYACGHVETSPSLPTWKGAERTNAYAAETEALINAQWWALTHDLKCPIHFHFDALSAGNAASGSWGYDSTHKVCTVSRVLAQCLTVCSGFEIRYHHVKAHSGDPWNEFADTLANGCREGTIIATTTPSFDWRPWIHGSYVATAEYLPMALTKLRGDAALPSGGATHLQYMAELGSSVSQHALWPLDLRATHQRDKVLSTTTATIRCGTFNVRTLKDGKANQSGLAEYLRTQFSSLGYHICALQETRAKETSTIESGDYIRLVSAGSQGQGGCELWFSRVHRLGQHEACTLQHLTVLHQDDSVLMVRQRIGNEFLVVITAHAPHSGHSAEERDIWWKRFSSIIANAHQRGRVLLLGDFNAQFGSEVERVVGDLLDDKTTPNGEAFGEVLSKHQLWIPSTFSHCHQGDHGTWVHPGTKKEIRLDYIALDRRLAAYNVHSALEDQIDNPGFGEDHHAVRLDFSFAMKKQRTRSKRSQIDELALCDPDNRKQVEKLLQDTATRDWNENVHDHYAGLAEELYRKLIEKFPQQRKQPRKHYISQTTWLWRASKIATKQALRQARKFHDADGEQTLLQQLKTASNRLRQMLQVDRQNHVEDLLAQVDQAPPSHLYAQLRRLGIGARFRKGTARALPMMKKEDGTYVESYEESQEEWRKHASALEGGQQITGPDLLQQCVKRQQLQLQHGSAPHAINLPTRIQVERACRRIKPFKARGPDGLPAGLYHHFPAMMASLLHPLMLKMSCLGTEPLGFKGGRLVHLYKGKGPADEPSNRRGILISNHASKVAHGSLRGQYTPFLEAAMLPMQVGGRPHKSVQQGAHALRLFMDLCRQRNLACGVIFLDIRTAY